MIDTPGGNYTGRFAPSPSGPLHFGSLIAAMGSYLQARRCAGRWLLRMEDHDRPREVPGAARRIIASLRAHGFEWDGPVLCQSQRGEGYERALRHLQSAGLVYNCRCSRRQLRDSARHASCGPIYPGTCRQLDLPDGDAALRLRVAGEIAFDDALLGRYSQDLSAELGDFVLRRRDGCYAYQLAVVVDDALQGVTEVVRGADLLDNTPRQIYLQRCLGLPTPRYLHLPVANNAAGEKLSKQTFAPALDDADPLPALRRAWAFLGQGELRVGSIDAFWRAALRDWRCERLPRARSLPAPRQDSAGD